MSTSSHKQFARNFVLYQDRVYGYITTLLSDRDAADEVFQQTSLILWDKWDQYDPQRDFVRWACGIAYYEVCTYLRRSRRPDRYFLSDQVVAKLSDDRLDVSQDLDEQLDALRECLNLLPKNNRHVIDAYYSGSRSVEDLARESGGSVNSIYKLLRRIRKRLMLCIEHRLRVEGGAG